MKQIFLLIPLVLLAAIMNAQKGTISGTIMDDEAEIAYANCYLKNTDYGTTTDADGKFLLSDISAGNYTLVISFIGYQTLHHKIQIKAGEDKTVHLTLQPNPKLLNDVVITGTRTARRQLNNPVAVNVLDAKTFDRTHSQTLSEGLCFQSGLRVETDCQTCNYTQLRMNGLAGSYSQVLIDNRPVFTSLMSLYSLEQIPAALIDRVEVVRGGGSVLHGANAIAGTINIITKEPEENSFKISESVSLIGGEAWDNFLNANVNFINDLKNAGISFFASNRIRQAYDANDDGFSELSKLRNNSFGFKSFLKPYKGHHITFNGWSIYEFRRGGNKMDLPADRADQSEERTHNILVGGIDYQYTPKGKNYWTDLYFSAQHTNRNHYTGINQSEGWGNTLSTTAMAGFQINYALFYWQGKNVLTAGAEYNFQDTFDEIPAYNYHIDQSIHHTGFFLQSDWDISKKITVLSGLRANQHSNVDELIFTPRVNLLYKPIDKLQVRSSYAKGFKAPQAFETDLHIAFSAGGISLVQIDPLLEAETSDSYNVSVDFNNPKEKYIYGFTIDAFYTRLWNTFVLQEKGTDNSGNQILERTNGSNSTVKGVTLESRFNYNTLLQLETGITIQSSTYDHPIYWSEEAPGTKEYLRTPDKYGYFVFTLYPGEKFNGSLSGVYTGPMQVPHYAGAPGVEEDYVFHSPTFFEANLQFNYTVKLHAIGQQLKFSAGVQNFLNAYQSNFDSGPTRDSNFIYGPAKPRTYFVKLELGSIL